MGAVFEAVHEQHRPARAAIKVLHPQFSADAGGRRRASSTRRAPSTMVQHPGIVEDLRLRPAPRRHRLHRHGATGGRVAERSGSTAPAAALACAEALRLARQIASALAAAHEQAASSTATSSRTTSSWCPTRDAERRAGQGARLRHGQGRGGVRRATTRPLKTRTGIVLGTPDLHVAGAVSRRQRRGRQGRRVLAGGDALRDAVGRPPFSGQGPGDLIAMHIVEPPTPLHERADNVSPDVATLVHEMLVKPPGAPVDGAGARVAGAARAGGDLLGRRRDAGGHRATAAEQAVGAAAWCSAWCSAWWWPARERFWR